MLSSFFLFFIPWQSSDLIITKVKMIVKITKREKDKVQGANTVYRSASLPVYRSGKIKKKYKSYKIKDSF